MTDIKEIVDKYYFHLKERDKKNLLALLSEDIIVTHHSQEGQFPWSGKFHGIEGFNSFFSAIDHHLNVVDVEITHSTTGKDKVINQCQGVWEYRESGYVVKAGMVNVFTVKSDKIAGYDVYTDTAAFAAGFNA